MANGCSRCRRCCGSTSCTMRVYFLHHRELLGALSLAAYETVKELMAAVVEGEKGFRPGVVLSFELHASIGALDALILAA